MPTELRYGVIGCGHLGAFHAQKAAALAEIKLVGVFDVDRAKAQTVAAGAGCRAFDSVDQLLDQVEAVSVVVPTESHYYEGMRCLRAGKHVLLEKPIAATVAEAKELSETAGQENLKLQVGHVERFNPVCASLKLLPETPHFIEGHRLSQFNPRGLDVAVIFDLMIHDLDLVLNLVPAPVREVRASAVAVISDKPDIANARLEFENGTVANLTASRISVKRMRKLRLFARDNYLSLDLLKKRSEHFLLAGQSDAAAPKGYMKISEYGPTGRRIMVGASDYPDHDALAAELRSFARAVIAGVPVAVDGQAATKALALAITIERVAREGLGRISR